MQSAGKEILITGGKGFLGATLSERLIRDQIKVSTLGISSGNNFQLDLSNQVPQFQTDFFGVIHAAGKAHSASGTVQQQQEFYNVNFQGTRNLTLALEKGRKLPEWLLFISSVAVYGADIGEMIDEEHELEGKTPYAKSKIQAEKFLTDWCATKKVRLTILRLPLLMGPRPPGNLARMIRAMKRGIYVGVGSAKKSMVLCEDVAQILLPLASIGGIYNLTDGRHPKLEELERAMSVKLGVRRPFRVPASFLIPFAWVGDRMQNSFPINSSDLKKLNSTLTFSDKKARSVVNWNPKSVIDNIPPLL